eukprot:Nk52_evm1s100 gene=Nk52_evmTU1s100
MNAKPEQHFAPSSITAHAPMDHVVIDLAGPFPVSLSGNIYVLVCVDVCTRMVFLRALPDKSAATIAVTLLDLFCTMGFPKILQSDNGKEFSNATLNELLSILRADHRFIAPYNPAANGIVERSVALMKQSLLKDLRGQTAFWDRSLPTTQLALNTRVLRDSPFTPFSLFFTRRSNPWFDYSGSTPDHPLPKDLYARIKKFEDTVLHTNLDVQHCRAHRNNADRRSRSPAQPIPTGMYVLKTVYPRNSKFQARRDGPYKVLRQTAARTYILQDMTGETLPSPVPRSQLFPVDYDPDTDSFEVEMILQHAKENNVIWYQVRWRGYDSRHDTWITADMFDSPETLRLYHASLKPSSGGSNVRNPDPNIASASKSAT